MGKRGHGPRAHGEFVWDRDLGKYICVMHYRGPGRNIPAPSYSIADANRDRADMGLKPFGS